MITETNTADGIQAAAYFSDDMKYRYSLLRSWDCGKPVFNFIGLNPSTADAFKLDPTCLGLLKRAKEWGYGSYQMLNLFAFRSTNPKGLLTVTDPVGDLNDWWLTGPGVTAIPGDITVCGWGSSSKLVPERAKQILTILKNNGVQPYALKVSEKTGQPWHPLYLRHDLKPFKWEPVW